MQWCWSDSNLQVLGQVHELQSEACNEALVITDIAVAQENSIDVKAQKQRQPEQAYTRSSASSLERNNADNLKFVQKKRERKAKTNLKPSILQ